MIDETVHNQRAEDKLHDAARRIDDLIAQTKDPVQQATLLVLSKMVVALDVNTQLTAETQQALANHREDFRNHDTEELKRMSWIKGAWWAIVGIFSVSVAAAGYVVTNHDLESKQMRSQLIELMTRVKVLEFSVLMKGRE